MAIKIAAIIPAHLNSVRLPGKVLKQFFDLPMLEHVRRRTLLCTEISDVYVATCDEEIATCVQKFNGKVIMTSRDHKTGMDRVAEAVTQVDCSHVIVVQGDEILLLPQHLQQFVQSIESEPQIQAWNATSPLGADTDLDNRAVVKCIVSNSQRIMLCFRRSPCVSETENQLQSVRKILGLIAFQKEFIGAINKLPRAPYESREFIEQSRIIENDYVLKSIHVDKSYVSINEPSEVDKVNEILKNDTIQMELLAKILK